MTNNINEDDVKRLENMSLEEFDSLDDTHVFSDTYEMKKAKMLRENGFGASAEIKKKNFVLRFAPVAACIVLIAIAVPFGMKFLTVKTTKDIKRSNGEIVSVSESSSKADYSQSGKTADASENDMDYADDYSSDATPLEPDGTHNFSGESSSDYTDPDTELDFFSGNDDDLIIEFDGTETDTDGDGFPDSVDPTPTTADAFYSYEGYIDYFYHGKAVLSFMLSTPNKDNYNVMDYDDENGGGRGFTAGHSWLGFSHEDGSLDMYGFGGRAVGLAALLQPKVASWIKCPDYIIMNSENEKDYEIIDYADTKYTPETTVRKNFMALPVVVKESDFETLKTYVEGYRKNFGLLKYNCTSFTADVFKYLGYELDVYTPLPTDASADEEDALMVESGSPAQAAYCFKTNYADEYVELVEYKLSDGRVTCAYVSAKSKANS
ncbi:MAG: hypothetical protein K5848_03825 [Lachnospiraceae bacterium]|nr:hypothetical protein [Lachnospiraceae bacterium]